MDYVVYDHCKIDSEIHTGITDGLVTANGATVRIAEYAIDSRGQRRTVFVDQLFDADSKVERGVVAFTGKSRHLIDNNGLDAPDAVVTVRVTKWRGCANCG